MKRAHFDQLDGLLDHQEILRLNDNQKRTLKEKISYLLNQSFRRLLNHLGQLKFACRASHPVHDGLLRDGIKLLRSERHAARQVASVDGSSGPGVSLPENLIEMLCVDQCRLIVKLLLVLGRRATSSLAPDVLERKVSILSPMKKQKNPAHLPLMDKLVVSLAPRSRHKALHNLRVAGKIDVSLNHARSGRISKALGGAVPSSTGDALIDGHLLSRSSGTSRLWPNASSGRSDNCSKTHDVFRLLFLSVKRIGLFFTP